MGAGAIMIRKGKYAKYKGEEYRYRKLEGNLIKLISNQQSDIKKGFEQLDQDIFTKIIDISDADELFSIYPYAKYKGELFAASEQGKTGKVLLSTDDAEIAKRYEFVRTDKYLYSKYVEWDDVEIIESRKPY